MQPMKIADVLTAITEDTGVCIVVSNPAENKPHTIEFETKAKVDALLSELEACESSIKLLNGKPALHIIVHDDITE